MPNQTLTSPFPATQLDVARLKQTAIDAVNDLGGTVSVHASKAKGQLKELAGHVQEESGQQVNEVKGKMTDLVNAGRKYVSENPVICLGAALTVGFVVGVTRRASSRDKKLSV